MRLYLRRDKSASGTGFVIYDEVGCERYTAVMKKTRLTTKFHIHLTDAQGNRAAVIRQLPVVGTFTFVFKVNKKHITLVCLNTRTKPFAYFYGSNWRILGNFAAKEFSIIDVDKTVIMNNTRHSGYCELEILDSSNELYCVCASVCANLINTVDKLAVQAV